MNLRKASVDIPLKNTEVIKNDREVVHIRENELKIPSSLLMTPFVDESPSEY